LPLMKESSLQKLTPRMGGNSKRREFHDNVVLSGVLTEMILEFDQGSMSRKKDSEMRMRAQCSDPLFRPIVGRWPATYYAILEGISC
jgi:hypothetical protein